jgi:hypothetical protein
VSQEAFQELQRANGELLLRLVNLQRAARGMQLRLASLGVFIEFLDDGRETDRDWSAQ